MLAAGARAVARMLVAIAIAACASAAGADESVRCRCRRWRPPARRRRLQRRCEADGRQAYVAAQQKFEEALAADEGLAEAYNNLAFSLRMQGALNRERALRHYDRALRLKPDLSRAHMYRGVLFTQMGDLARARADHARLLSLDPRLAGRLERIITGGGRDDYAGLTPQYD